MTSNSANVVAISSVTPVNTNFHGQTGPKTEAGKNHSKFNALKHGRTAKSKLLPFEDPREYNQLAKDTFADLKPEGQVQIDLTQQFIDCLWRRNRMERRISVEQKSIFDLLTKEKLASMLGIEEIFLDHLPEYLLDLSKRFGHKQIELADLIWRQYERMMTDFCSGEFTDWPEMRIHYDALFEEFEIWIKQFDDLPPLLTPQRDQFNPKWFDDQEMLFETLKEFAISMYFQANFMSWKGQIRNTMNIWYYMHKQELRQIDQYDLVLIKETHLSHTIIERLVKLQKYKNETTRALHEHYQHLSERMSLKNKTK